MNECREGENFYVKAKYVSISFEKCELGINASSFLTDCVTLDFNLNHYIIKSLYNYWVNIFT